MSLGRIEVDVVANTAQYSRSLKQAAAESVTFGDRIKSVGRIVTSFGSTISAGAAKIVNLKTVLASAAVGLVTSKMVGSLNAAAEHVDKLGKAADRLDLPIQDLSALDYMAGKAGVSFESLSKMASKAAQATQAMVAKGQTTARLGEFTVQLTDAEGRVRSISELLPELARGIESAGSAGERLNLARKFFGRSGAEDFVTMLRDVGPFIKGFAAEMERARRLGVVYDQDQVQKLKAYTDAVTDVQKAWEGVRVKIATQLAPAATQLMLDLAEDIADVPDVVAGIRQAIERASQGSDQDGARIERLVGATVEVLTTGASEAAQIFVRVITEGWRSAATNAVIGFVQEYRSLLPDWMVAATVGDPVATRQVDIDRIEARKRSLMELAAAVGRGEKSVWTKLDPESGVEYSVQGTVEDLADTLRSTVRDIIGQEGSVDQAVEVLDKMILARQRVLGLSDGAVGQQRAAVLDQSGANVSETVREAIANLKAAIADWNTAKEDIKVDGGFVGPPVPEELINRQSMEKTFASLRKGWDKLMAEAREAGAGIQQAFGDGMRGAEVASIKLWVDSVEEAEKKIKALKQSLEDNNATIEREIAGVRELRAEVVNLGVGYKLTEADVDDLIVKIKKKHEEEQKKVVTLSEKMSDEIKSFAADAGQAWADFALEGQGSLEDLAKSWTKTLIAMATQYLVFKPIFDYLGSSFGNAFGGTAAGKTVVSPPAQVQARAGGGPVQAGRPYVVGEKGPELVKFGRDGFVFPHGSAIGMPMGGKTTVNIIDQRSSGARPVVSENTGPDGTRRISILLRDELRQMLGDGSLDKTMRLNYGIARRPG